MSATTTADRGFTWSDEETALLLRLWGGNDAQNELTGNKRNFVVYEKISEAMNSLGFMRSASQCREKIKRMKREYTLTKQYNEKSEGPRKTMRFYEQFEKVLLEKQKIQGNTPAKVSSTIPNTPNLNPESDDKEQHSKKRTWNKVDSKTKTIHNKNHAQENCEGLEKDSGNPWTPDVVLVEAEETPSSSLLENHSSASATSLNNSPFKSKRQKIASKMSFFQTMIDSLTLKFLKYQNESDARFLDKIEQLEQERMAMDERVKKMWLDFEERRRTDEREHEMNVMALFKDILDQVKVNHRVND